MDEVGKFTTEGFTYVGRTSSGTHFRVGLRTNVNGMDVFHHGDREPFRSCWKPDIVEALRFMATVIKCYNTGLKIPRE